MTAPARDLTGFWYTCPITKFTFPQYYTSYPLESLKAILRIKEKNPLRYTNDRDLIKWCRYMVNIDKATQLLTGE